MLSELLALKDRRTVAATDKASASVDRLRQNLIIAKRAEADLNVVILRPEFVQPVEGVLGRPEPLSYIEALDVDAKATAANSQLCEYVQRLLQDHVMARAKLAETAKSNLRSAESDLKLKRVRSQSKIESERRSFRDENRIVPSVTEESALVISGIIGVTGLIFVFTPLRVLGVLIIVAAICYSSFRLRYIAWLQVRLSAREAAKFGKAEDIANDEMRKAEEAFKPIQAHLEAIWESTKTTHELAVSVLHSFEREIQV